MALILADLSRCNLAQCALARLCDSLVQYEAEGGVVAGGSAYVTVDPYLYTGSGSAIAGGTADVDADYDVADAGGAAITAGAADFYVEYDLVGSGGAIADGLADVDANYDVADAGGAAITDGVADFYVEYDYEASGEAITDGTGAPFLLGFYGNAGGTALTAGSSGIYVAYNSASGLGSAATSGEAIVRFIIDIKGLPIFLRTFDGDVRLRLTVDGGMITIWGGQPEMDAGLETAVHISLFTETGWWGNALARPGEEIGSTLETAFAAPLTNQARLDVIERARAALAWLTETGVAKSVEVDATIPSLGELALTVTVTEPDKAPALFRYSISWRSQRIHMEAA